MCGTGDEVRMYILLLHAVIEVRVCVWIGFSILSNLMV